MAPRHDFQPRPTWHNHAACRDHPPALFFPEARANGGHATVQAARAICNRCPVQTECLTWAIEQPEVHGVWGATSVRERRRLRREHLKGKAA